MAKKKSKKKNKVAKPRKAVSRKLQRKPSKPFKVKAKAQATAQAPPKPKPGAFVWHELMTTDVSRSKSFYGQLLGWKTSEMEMMPGFNYTVINHAKQPHGGMMAITPEHGDMKPHWDVYISVRDVDATAALCEQLGGEVIVPPHDIPVGRWATLKDPSGAQFCVYKSKNR